jgi:hypothetical protein
MPTFSHNVWAQAYPTSPVRFVVPLAAGGGLDFTARLVGEYLTHSMGQQVYIENKTSARRDLLRYLPCRQPWLPTWGPATYCALPYNRSPCSLGL